MKKKCVTVLSLLICASLLSSCSLEMTNIRLDLMGNYCETLDCYKDNMPRPPYQRRIDEEGNIKWTWETSVTRKRPLPNGGQSTNGEYTHDVREYCWFAVTFDSEEDLIETEWYGPGCFDD